MKLRPVIFAALALGVVMAGTPAFAQTGVHHDMQRTGAAEGVQKTRHGQRGYSTGPMYNHAPGQSGQGEVQPCIHAQTSCM
jgi:hypothetical protein